MKLLNRYFINIYIQSALNPNFANSFYLMLIVIYIYESLDKQIVYTTYFIELLSKVFFLLKSLHFNHKILNNLKVHFGISSTLVQ